MIWPGTGARNLVFLLGLSKLVRAVKDYQTTVLLKLLFVTSTLSTGEVGGSVTDARADRGFIRKLIIFSLFLSSFIAERQNSCE